MHCYAYYTCSPNFIDGDDLFTYTPSQQILSPDPSLGRLDPASLTVSHDPGVNVSKAPASTRQLPKELYRQRTAETLKASKLHELDNTLVMTRYAIPLTICGDAKNGRTDGRVPSL